MKIIKWYSLHTVMLCWDCEMVLGLAFGILTKSEANVACTDEHICPDCREKIRAKYNELFWRKI